MRSIIFSLNPLCNFRSHVRLPIVNFQHFLIEILCLFTAFNAVAAVRYVNVNSANPVSPYISWATAATSIQDAIDAAATWDEIVVTNSLYKRLEETSRKEFAPLEPVDAKNVGQIRAWKTKVQL